LNPADGIYFFNNGTTSYGIWNSQANPWYEVDSNIIANLFIVPGSSGTGTLYGYYDFGSPTNGTRYLRGTRSSDFTGRNLQPVRCLLKHCAMELQAPTIAISMATSSAGYMVSPPLRVCLPVTVITWRLTTTYLTPLSPVGLLLQVPASALITPYQVATRCLFCATG